MRLSGLRYLVLAAAAATLPWGAQAQQPPPPTPQLFAAMKTPLPPGPFASWPENARKPALMGVISRCTFMTGMAFGDYQGPKEAFKSVATAVASACIAKVMPDDWPGKAAELQQSSNAYEAAKRLDPNAPDPERLAGSIAHAMVNPH